MRETRSGELGTPIDPEHLVRLPDGALWVIAPGTCAGLSEPLYFSHHVFDNAPRRLRGGLALHEAGPDEGAALFRDAVEAAVADLQAVTVLGALTRIDNGRGRANAPSIDLVCAGPRVDRDWRDGVIALIVRPCPVDPPGIDVEGPINVAVTVVPKSGPAWLRLLRGEPVDQDFQTHHIRAGERFRLAEHCDWVNDPYHEIFTPLTT